MLFEREDFYVGGVSVGGADLRFLVRPGDPISVQVGGNGRANQFCSGRWEGVERFPCEASGYPG